MAFRRWIRPRTDGHGVVTPGGIAALVLFYAAWGFAYFLFFIQYIHE